jgi:hypothetical protein
MAEPALFGAPLGIMAAEQHVAERSLRQAQTEQALAQAAAQPAHARLWNAQASEAEQRAGEQQRTNDILAAMAASQESGGAVDPVQLLHDQGSALIAGGAPTRGRELLKSATDIRRIQGITSLNELKQYREVYEGTKARMELASQFINSITDDASFSRANAGFRAQTGEDLFESGQTYSPELINFTRRQMLSVKSQMDLDLRTREQNLREQGRRDVELHRESIRNYQKWRRDFEDAREKRLAKGGGKPVRDVSPRLVEMAMLSFKDLVPEMTSDTTERYTAAQAIASDAQRLRSQNPGLDPLMAIQQAIRAAQDAGEFVETPKWFSKAKVLRSAGRTPETAMNAPPVDKMNQLQKGKWYKFPGAGVRYWTGEVGLSQTEFLTRDLSEDEQELEGTR